MAASVPAAAPAPAEVRAQLAALDWSRPWYLPFAGEGDARAAAVRAGAAVHGALDMPSTSAAAEDSQPPRFVPQSALPAGQAYEAHIFATGAVPTRDNLHDFFNGLVWRHLPRCKRQLNRVQAAEIARDGVGAVRGPVRDAVTLLDENGALLDAPPALWDALLARDWRQAFVTLRPLWAQARLLLVGHALLEQLERPRKNLTAHVLRLRVPLGGPDAAGLQAADLQAADALLAPQLTAQALAAKPFTPLPVMGIPGWCADNENFSFYDDSLVFRPARA